MPACKLTMLEINPLIIYNVVVL